MISSPIPSVEPKLRTHTEMAASSTFLAGTWVARLYIKAPFGSATVKVRLYKEDGDPAVLCSAADFLGEGVATALTSIGCKYLPVVIPMPEFGVDNERIYVRIEKVSGPPISLCWDCAASPSNLVTPPFVAD